MAATAITERRVAGEPVADGVYRFDDGIVNWYLVEDSERVAAIDSGFPADWKTVTSALERMGRSPQQLTDVLLTHAHVDHTGFAERAREETGATVWMHPKEVEFARSPLPMAKSERNPLLYQWRPPTMALMAVATLKLGPFGQRIKEWKTFDDGDVLDDAPGAPRIVFTPGHSFGHCAIHLPDRGVVFSGDAIVTRDPYTGLTGPRLVARAATADVEQNLRSLDAIAATGARTLLPGHGEPWTDGADRADDLARAAGSA